MITYSLILNGTSIQRSDGATIPADPNNTDYQAYLKWVAAGNTCSPAPAPTAAQLWAAYQAQAQAALTESDKTALRCYENAVALPAAWATYRKALRTIVGASSGDPAQPLPTKPAYPAGT